MKLRTAILELDVLAALVHNPDLLDADERLTIAAFPGPVEARIFEAIASWHADGLSGPISAEDLQKRTDLPEDQVHRFRDGIIPVKAEVFRHNVGRLLQVRLVARQEQLLNQLSAIRVKTGESDPELRREILKLEAEITALEPGQSAEEPPACTVEDLAVKQIPKIEWLVRPIVERYGFTLIGAQKGVGKSLLATQLGLHAAAGTANFLTDSITISKPSRVLLIQQEVSLAGMQDRLLKMRGERIFDLQGRFVQLTTTGAWWNLTKKEDFGKLRRLIDKHKPDILILDPLYTFYPRELNTSGDIAPMMEILGALKTNYNLGLVVLHHFSNKENADDVQQRASVGRFMGHSMIANSADTTVGLDFLHPKYRQAALPLPYQNYVCVDITSRHGEWPPRFAIERQVGCLLFEPSSIWTDLGRNIIPGQIEDVLEANDGQMLMKDLIRHLSGDARPTTVRRSIDEAIRSGTITKTTLPGKGKPALLRLAK